MTTTTSEDNGPSVEVEDGTTNNSQQKRVTKKRALENTSTALSAKRKANGAGGDRPVALITATLQRGRKPLPTRAVDGTLQFADFPEFRPNLTPKEVIQLGSFGGTYFRPITSGVTTLTYRDAWREFPVDWFEGLDIARCVISERYDPSVNTYAVHCGGDLKEWEESGWICEIDPYGWFQWYCRFYLGRRCSDDYRQITRALGIMGPSGRWKKNLINKCMSCGLPPEQALEDKSISPKIRQLLQHWAYRITLKDLLDARGSKR
eukprot:gene11012-12260_t